MGRPRRVLVSEGSSLSARQSITALGLAGHTVEVCDPDPLRLGRFSRFVRRLHRCPAAGRDPWACLDFVVSLLNRGERVGGELRWHGALSLDYIFQEATGTPLFIDANPRLVEPMNGVFSGINLADLLVRVSRGESAAPAGPPRQPVGSHMLSMGLLAAGARRRSRLAVLAELLRAAGKSGIYAGGREELLPLRLDCQCAFPLGYLLARLLIDPASAGRLANLSVSSYSLSPEAARSIARGGLE
jgi:hypothetical protein